MNNNTKIIYRRFPEILEKRGYININHRMVNSKDDLAEISSVFRDTRYETFRIIYMKDNKIAGYESISSRMPNYVELNAPTLYHNAAQKAEMCFYKILDRMNRLGANGYYMVHNHPSDNAVASKDDMRTTEHFAQKVKGFKGHLIINSESYAWISVNDFGEAVAENLLKINKLKKSKIEMDLKSKSLYDIPIKSRDDLVSVVSLIKSSPDYSIAILTDSQTKIRLILDIPNRMINMHPDELKGYFRNLARETGSVRVFFATKDDKTFDKAIVHQVKGTFKDVICYKDDNEEKLYLKESSPLTVESDLFDNCRLSLGEELEDYKTTNDLENELLENPTNKKIIVLYKAVGKDPVPMKIEDTLEAKQELVGGLIEIVPLGNVLLVCNDEGKILNMPPNLSFPNDYIAGDCFLVGDDYERGELKSLTKQEVLDNYNILMKHNVRNHQKESSSTIKEKRIEDIQNMWNEFINKDISEEQNIK